MLSRLSSLRTVVVRSQRLPASSFLARSYTSSTHVWDEATTKKEEAAEANGKGMKKADLVSILASKHDLSQNESRAVLETIIDTITKALKENKSVGLTRFGSFSTYVAKARTGRNPRTGDPVEIKAKRRVKFSPFQGLRDALSDDETD
mmetsp:Transcript_12695/g.24412  ORF Transcript_12695/g.24412 Transcript_12695/m.24412 type:complete len:148 (-) Transcript_12695:121-564(-)|eukprot:scaffold10909_cov172-Amphora_coffeaeformis.AAC.10